MSLSALCRWDIVNASSQWEMHVLATRPISEGEELFLSYDERENDYFFVQYGFVPMQNPHDMVELFASAQDARAWCASQVLLSAMCMTKGPTSMRTVASWLT